MASERQAKRRRHNSQGADSHAGMDEIDAAQQVEIDELQRLFKPELKQVQLAEAPNRTPNILGEAGQEQHPYFTVPWTRIPIGTGAEDRLGDEIVVTKYGINLNWFWQSIAATGNADARWAKLNEQCLRVDAIWLRLCRGDNNWDFPEFWESYKNPEAEGRKYNYMFGGGWKDRDRSEKFEGSIAKSWKFYPPANVQTMPTFNALQQNGFPDTESGPGGVINTTNRVDTNYGWKYNPGVMAMRRMSVNCMFPLPKAGWKMVWRDGLNDRFDVENVPAFMVHWMGYTAMLAPGVLGVPECRPVPGTLPEQPCRLDTTYQLIEFRDN